VSLRNRMPASGSSGLAGQRGQALAEALVAGLVLVPLVLLVALLGKYQSVQTQVIGASRWLAFECTVRPDQCRSFSAHPELVDEMRRRFFARADTEILTHDMPEDPPAASERQALWVDRSNRPLLERFADVGATVTEPEFNAGANVAGSLGGRSIAGAAQILSDLAGPGRFGLDIGKGLFDARVQVALARENGRADLLTQLDSLGLNVGAHVAVLTDAWNARTAFGPDGDTVESRVARGSRLNGAIETALDLAYAPTRALLALAHALQVEPSASKFRYHEVDVDLVPADRLPQ
jgi:hypothetical protein